MPHDARDVAAGRSFSSISMASPRRLNACVARGHLPLPLTMKVMDRRVDTAVLGMAMQNDGRAGAESLCSHVRRSDMETCAATTAISADE